MKTLIRLIKNVPLVILVLAIQYCAKSPTSSLDNETQNAPPVIMELSSTLADVAVEGSYKLTCIAEDPDGDPY